MHFNKLLASNRGRQTVVNDLDPSSAQSKEKTQARCRVWGLLNSTLKNLLKC